MTSFVAARGKGERPCLGAPLLGGSPFPLSGVALLIFIFSKKPINILNVTPNTDFCKHLIPIYLPTLGCCPCGNSKSTVVYCTICHEYTAIGGGLHDNTGRMVQRIGGTLNWLPYTVPYMCFSSDHLMSSIMRSVPYWIFE